MNLKSHHRSIQIYFFSKKLCSFDRTRPADSQPASSDQKSSPHLNAQAPRCSQEIIYLQDTEMFSQLFPSSIYYTGP